MKSKYRLKLSDPKEIKDLKLDYINTFSNFVRKTKQLKEQQNQFEKWKDEKYSMVDLIDMYPLFRQMFNVSDLDLDNEFLKPEEYTNKQKIRLITKVEEDITFDTEKSLERMREYLDSLSKKLDELIQMNEIKKEIKRLKDLEQKKFEDAEKFRIEQEQKQWTQQQEFQKAEREILRRNKMEAKKEKGLKQKTVYEKLVEKGEWPPRRSKIINDDVSIEESQIKKREKIISEDDNPQFKKRTRQEKNIIEISDDDFEMKGSEIVDYANVATVPLEDMEQFYIVPINPKTNNEIGTEVVVPETGEDVVIGRNTWEELSGNVYVSRQAAKIMYNIATDALIVTPFSGKQVFVKKVGDEKWKKIIDSIDVDEGDEILIAKNILIVRVLKK